MHPTSWERDWERMPVCEGKHEPRATSHVHAESVLCQQGRLAVGVDARRTVCGQPRGPGFFICTVKMSEVTCA